MKRQLAWTMAVLLALAWVAQPGFGQIAKDAQDVLNKMIDVQGGRKYLETIKDSTMTGTMEIIALGVSGTITIYQKEPNKMRMDMEFMGMLMTQAYDGQLAWATNPQTGTTEQMPEAQVKEFARQAMGTDSLLNPQKYGITYALKPKAQVEGKDYLVIEQTMADGHKSTIYIDPATYLPYKVETMALGMAGVEVKSESYSTDYQKVGQSMVAHAIRVVQDGADFMTMNLTSVTYNSGLEDSLFLMSK